LNIKLVYLSTIVTTLVGYDKAIPKIKIGSCRLLLHPEHWPVVLVCEGTQPARADFQELELIETRI
jgi:hypothetical protein